MAKLTMKERVIQLEQELEKERKRNNELTQYLNNIQAKSDSDFESSPYFKQMKREVETYKEYKKLYEKIKAKRIEEHDLNAENKEKIQKLINENEELRRNIKKHNERGAGRKTKIAATTKKNIISDRQKGMKIKELAEKYNCAVGTIHKIINENNESIQGGK